MDESFDTAKAGVFVVGGIMGRGYAIFELERKWEAVRKRTDIDMRYFKASDCANGTKEFAKFVADPKNITPKSERDSNQSVENLCPC